MELMDFEVIDRNKSTNKTMSNRAIENNIQAGMLNATKRRAKCIFVFVSCEKVFFLLSVRTATIKFIVKFGSFYCAFCNVFAVCVSIDFKEINLIFFCIIFHSQKYIFWSQSSWQMGHSKPLAT